MINKINKDNYDKIDLNYNYLPDLTSDIDSIESDFDPEIVHKIVLWKLNRFPFIQAAALTELNKINKTDKKIDEQTIKSIMSGLLNCKGIRLGIASAILRFKNPNVFQIIDQRIFRVIYGKEFKHPNSSEASCNLYLQYLNDLRQTCIELSIPFHLSDRILYQADKRLNKDIKIKY